MKNKKRFIIWCTIFLFVALIGTVSKVAYALPQFRTIEVSTANNRSLADSITKSGSIEPFKKQQITVNSSEKVKQVYVKQGDLVSKGDLLLELDDVDFNNSIKSETINLRKLERELKEQIDPNHENEMNKLSNAMKQSQIQHDGLLKEYEDAKKEIEQNKLLYDLGSISKEEYEASIKGADQLLGDIKIHEIQMESLKSDINKSDYDKQDEIDDLKYSIELAKSNIENRKNEFAKEFRSSIEGKIVKCDVTIGENDLGNNSTIVIYDLSKYIIELNLRQDEADGLAKEQKVIVKSKTLQKEYTATIFDISNEAIPLVEGSKDYYKVIKISIDSPDEDIKVGTEAEIVINKKVKLNALAVKFDGIITNEEGDKFVYLFKDDTATLTFVKTGMETDFYVEITEGLIKGDQYIINPPERIQKKTTSRVWRYNLK